MSKKIYHVSKNGKREGTGTKDDPFITINQAASIAMAGDTVIVHEGVYREWVKPLNKGLSNSKRITYKAAENEKVVIKGSERIQNWENIKDSIWRVEISNEFFGDYNPYEKEVEGDWILYETSERKHLGEVYLNGMSFYEVASIENLENPQVRHTVIDDWTQQETKIIHSDQTKYVWYAKVQADTTIIYANFHDSNPNEELVEINVRQSCFYPTKTGIDYITVQGFEMAQAATPWTPPTADQPGLIGANWSKGWIIEDNIIHDSKCSAISIGKEGLTGHNYFTTRKDKPGYHYQIESVFAALNNGWSKEYIGSHIIRNNTIYDCGQNGIVGHLGCVFSEIYGNHIYNIGLKREFYGHEIGGIKLHAAIDVQIHNNRIHDCSLGLWLDWQTQGTRISKNLFYQNSRDLFVEVSHGPYVVDHNIFASSVEMDNYAQGGAYINNLMCGWINQQKVLDRSTPYHVPHSTKVAGFSPVYGGDDRYIGNIFIGNRELEDKRYGTAIFNGHSTSLDEYIEKVQMNMPGDLGIFLHVEEPVYIKDNLYIHGAKSYEKEKNAVELKDFDPQIEIIEEDNQVFLSIHLPKEIEELKTAIASTSTLSPPRIVSQDFENPDGTELILDSDYLNQSVTTQRKLGPISTLKTGQNKIRIW